MQSQRCYQQHPEAPPRKVSIVPKGGRGLNRPGSPHLKTALIDSRWTSRMGQNSTLDTPSASAARRRWHRGKQAPVQLLGTCRSHQTENGGRSLKKQSISSVRMGKKWKMKNSISRLCAEFRQKVGWKRLEKSVLIHILQCPNFLLFAITWRVKNQCTSHD